MWSGVWAGSRESGLEQASRGSRPPIDVILGRMDRCGRGHVRRQCVPPRAGAICGARARACAENAGRGPLGRRVRRSARCAAPRGVLSRLVPMAIDTDAPRGWVFDDAPWRRGWKGRRACVLLAGRGLGWSPQQPCPAHCACAPFRGARWRIALPPDRHGTCRSGRARQGTMGHACRDQHAPPKRTKTVSAVSAARFGRVPHSMRLLSPLMGCGCVPVTTAGHRYRAEGGHARALDGRSHSTPCGRRARF